MLPLPDFQLHTPQSLTEAVQLLQQLGPAARILAGGTDLLVNMKHRFNDAEHLVHLGAIDALHHITHHPDGAFSLGASVSLASLRDSPLIQQHLPALAMAAGGVASPQLQNMGTLGGNVCLDTRCVYINQTYFWRQALGFCLKKDGTECHVVKGGQLCVAAQSSDTVPALLIYDATVEILGPNGTRILPLEDLYKKDGAQHLTLEPGELLTRVHVPPQHHDLRATYLKHRTRASIDFPVLSIAAAVRLDHQGHCHDVRVASTCMGSRPRRIARLDKLAQGQPFNDALIDEIAAQTAKQLNPLDNLLADKAWRKAMIPVFTRRALHALAEQP